LLIFLFVLSIIPLCIFTVNPLTYNKHNELYSPELVRLNSVQKLSDYIDSVYLITSKSKGFDTVLYVAISSNIIKKRFYHGLSHYSITDNWIAYLSGKLFWSHFSAIVNPDDILKHAEGLCSQQTIVFLEILKLKGIDFRTIGLGYKEGPGHFLSEVNYNGTWHLHDVTVEPKWERVSKHHKSLDYYINNKDSLFLAYDGLIDRKVFDKIMEKVEFGKVNQFPANKMLLFHQSTLFLTYMFPFLFFSLFVITLFNNKRISKRAKSTEALVTKNETVVELS
jgi:hypothetical protein